MCDCCRGDDAEHLCSATRIADTKAQKTPWRQTVTHSSICLLSLSVHSLLRLDRCCAHDSTPLLSVGCVPPGAYECVSKCFPVLYYGLEACRLQKSQYTSINYVINSTFRKLFNTRSQDVVGICLEMFNCLPAEKAIAIRKRNFLNKFCVTNNDCVILIMRRKNWQHC